MANKNPQKIPKKFICETCDYCTSNKKDYSKHISTPKHERLMAANDFECKNPQKSPNIANYICICGKTYKHMSSLCKHKSKCGVKETENIALPMDETKDKELIFRLLKQNTQLIEQNAELVKNGIHNTTHNTNSHNKTFN